MRSGTSQPPGAEGEASVALQVVDLTDQPEHDVDRSRYGTSPPPTETRDTPVDQSESTAANGDSGHWGTAKEIDGALAHARPERQRVISWAALGSHKGFLGQGEFALAHKTTLDGKQVALKRLKPAQCDYPAVVLGLKREIALMCLMDHPNVLPAIGLGEHEARPFMVLELLTSVLRDELPGDPATTPFWVRRRQVRAIVKPGQPKSTLQRELTLPEEPFP